MDKSLRDRLKRLRGASAADPKATQGKSPESPDPTRATRLGAALAAAAGGPAVDAGDQASKPGAPAPRGLSGDWTAAAPEVLRRSFLSDRISRAPPALSPEFRRLLAPGDELFSPESAPASDRLVFFDLETTGLSGGAGTLAFLAAFGRLELSPAEGAAAGAASVPARLRIVQLLLLDYPGEGDFIRLLLAEFRDGDVLVSFNGKSFDAQLLRTRCVMNGERPPFLPHLDLLHPSRRLWKRPLGSCSLGNLERAVLGAERVDDMPGSEAPDAWFGFLKNGDAGRLSAIAEHNGLDIEGLALLLGFLDGLVRAPLEAALAGARGTGVPVDAEALALSWLRSARAEAREAGRPLVYGDRLIGLLEAAAAEGAPRARFALARLRLSRVAVLELEGPGTETAAADTEALALLESVAAGESRGFYSAPPALRAASCRLLSARARRGGDRAAARAQLERALGIEGLAPSERAVLEKRLARG